MTSLQHGWYDTEKGYEFWWTGSQRALITQTGHPGYLTWLSEALLEESNVHATLAEAKQHVEESIPELERLAGLIEEMP
jgi:hypothetical protein